ncbi:MULTISPECIES: 16S rRNA (guanine(527)-N(7))-methyltransferase RsmG [Cutibacterium]|jgi:16S rRNA (guanine527-N7)-methyltransferase|uniref:Ribosomal RNA small subunit methyltransferase G n=1 Tax=Cutibacterium acnes TaxID=1747 RepID=A0AA44U2D9_CUTAC|nr:MULTISPECIES: 16S rRNA (guanine(527)-N(7))-methyltransferase RsmG [Cutibacterium]MBX7474950.1 16S rRNA (guanine(527)-N(7))-methyltransferase RsmG [Streptomyces sp. MAG02]OFJ83192.1 16S rRNA methyltransferase G [Propionibacterium sp. HMSC065F07]OFL44979.1 16S rRNA methyltransferase G [Propionibacterium sp. HMSC068C01]OFP51667.1 16S rRNA methyltransferase G [Propionibacterium sp. HMSC067A01]OFQ65448.1 16S rRNA methyltransferase G [Propionibacterium sp. HMSC075A12]
MFGMTLVSDDAIAVRLYRDNYKTIRQYVDILASRGVDWGLIGPREIGRLWERHILNSIALESLIPEGCRVADVGSGAGLPGIPLAILRPDLEMILIEPMLRRSNFLTEAIDELGLDDRVSVVRGRAEDADLHVDVVVSRAVAKLATLINWTADLIVDSGSLLALKGQSADDEVVKAKKELSKRRLSAEVLLIRADPASDVTRAVRVRRTGK